jgi:hypothetical protein
MRRIFIFREGNMMGALAGPDPVRGVAGFGVTIGDALRDLAGQFQEHGYRLQPPAVVNVAGTTVQATGFTPADILEELANKLAGYEERDFPPLNWGQISREPPV